MQNESLCEAGGQPLGDAGAGEGVGGAEVEVQLEVREGVGMDDKAGGCLRRDDAHEVFISPDQVDEGGDAVGNEDGAGVNVLAHERAVGRPDGVAGFFRESGSGSNEGSLDRADDGAGVETQGFPARGGEEIEVCIH